MRPLRALAYAQKHRQRFVSEMREFLAYPSVSSQPQRAADVKRCAAWLANHLGQIGFHCARVIETAGHPIVFATWHRAPRRPTLLIYGHYDVLPGGPLRSWRTPPFTPTMKGPLLFCRGASDDKGQLFCHVKAMECYLRSTGKLPLNVTCIFEGEEEIGSPHLPPFIQRNAKALHADVVVISDTHMLGPRQPAISYAQRGGLRAEVEVRGAPEELHSGSFGGAVHNPLEALVDILCSLHDECGRIAIPGFYGDVQDLSASERLSMARSGPTDQNLLSDAKVQSGWGEHGYSLYERTTARPSLTVSGIAGGHQGEGVKSIIPTRATAKLSFRLVPRQDPDRIAILLREHIANITPRSVQSSVSTSAPIQPVLIDRRHAAFRAAAEAYNRVFGISPVFLRSGGSIPIIHTFQQSLKCPVILMGFALPKSHIHGPNESLHLPTFSRSIQTSIWFQSLVAGIRGGSAPCAVPDACARSSP